jgi:hypothetical protein
VSLKFIEQFGELEWFEEQSSGAEDAAKKLNAGGAIDEKHASGAEARIDFAVFAARLKSRPDTKPIFTARLTRIPQGRKSPLGSR